MQKVWLEGIAKNLRKPKDSKVNTEVQLINGNEKEFMDSYITKIQEERNYFFQAPKSTSKDYYFYACERSNKAKGQSKGESSKTRANSCQAYVSFKMVREAGYKAVIIRHMLEHTGHNVSNPEELTKNPVDPELLGFVEMWLNQGLSVSQVVLKSCNWAQSHGHTDKHNRRYYLTPNDVRLVKRSLQSIILPDIDDSVSVDKLISTDLKENICFYQPITKDQPLIIVVQTPAQKALLQENPNPMIFMDASYKGLTSYGYAFYALLLVNQTGRGVPFAYFIVSHESSETLTVCLKSLSSCNPGFYPRSVMIDRDLKELGAIRQTFPKTKVLLCWFHVLQAVHRWLVKKDGGNLSPAQRNTVIHAMMTMKACMTEEDFESVSASKCRDLEAQFGSSRVTHYLRDQWFPFAALWANFGRLFQHNSSDTNNKAERFFFTIKYQFLRGQANKRVDQLLQLLCGDVQKYYNYLDDLIHAGRLNTSSSSSSSSTSVPTTSMLGDGLHEKIHIGEDGRCSLPEDFMSTVSDPRIITVDLVWMLCDCKTYDRGNLCKHTMMAKTEAQRRGINIQVLRNRVAKQYFDNDQFYIDGDCLSVYHHDGNATFVFRGESAFCTCTANSYQEKCVCLHLADILEINMTSSCMAMTESEIAHQLCPKPKPTVQTMLSDLLEWSHSPNYKYSRELHNTIQKAHKMAFANFGIVSKKRKISALHAYRQRIEKAKREARETFKPVRSHRLRVRNIKKKSVSREGIV
ncbi:uncharacterized protein LOC111194919 isoform X1 [Astyanax mexicanus]|uniref:uncharacterized protein LOC111194919 isoform X1 n=1 Tax=Astyanax mexicanus TaxID=7994 RepID=UPI0020CAF4A7|nr:uncharacterized protein LOC111194919 isoform X1 [Astyanax mexicanus]